MNDSTRKYTVRTRQSVVITPIPPTRIRKYLTAKSKIAKRSCVKFMCVIERGRIIPVVLLSDACIEPLAMMVKSHNTLVAKSAVLTAVVTVGHKWAK